MTNSVAPELQVSNWKGSRLHPNSKCPTGNIKNTMKANSKKKKVEKQTSNFPPRNTKVSRLLLESVLLKNCDAFG